MNYPFQTLGELYSFLGQHQQEVLEFCPELPPDELTGYLKAIDLSLELDPEQVEVAAAVSSLIICPVSPEPKEPASAEARNLLEVVQAHYGKPDPTAIELYTYELMGLLSDVALTDVHFIHPSLLKNKQLTVSGQVEGTKQVINSHVPLEDICKAWGSYAYLSGASSL